MATTPTNLPVPSESPRDLKFNAGKIDEFVTSLVNTYVDRFGNEHYTIEGLRWLAQQAIAQYGWIPFGTFQAGATLTLPNQILKDTTDGEYYRWDGALPKSVPSGSTPASTGGTGVGAWISVGDAELRSDLASLAGAGMSGYDPEGEYLDGTVGKALGPFVATGGTREVSREDRELQRLSAIDFSQFPQDAGAATNAAIARIRSEFNTTYPDTAGGIIYLPRGRSAALSPIAVNLIPGAGGVGISIKGQGIAASTLDFIDAPGDSDGVTGEFAAGPLYGEFSSFTIARARSALRLMKGSRLKINSIEAYLPTSDGFLFGNLIMSEINNLIVTSGSSHGISYTPNVAISTAPTEFEHTSIAHHNNWVRNTAGTGHRMGNMNYSISFANGVDNTGQYGYDYSGIINGMTVISDGAESNQRSGFQVTANRPTDVIRGLTFKNIYGRGNNKAGGYASLLGVSAFEGGGTAEVIVEGAVNNPQAGSSAGADIIANGPGALVRIHGNCTLPNGWTTLNNAYIDYTPVTYLTSKAITAGTGTSVCGFKSTQGYGTRYAGMVTVVVGSDHPSVPGRETSVYQLLVIRSTGLGGQITTIAQLGRIASSGNSATWPSFVFTHHSSASYLVATPQSGVGGGTFWFEISTVGQIVAISV